MERVRSPLPGTQPLFFRNAVFRAMRDASGFAQLRQANSSFTFVRNELLEPQNVTIALWVRSLKWEEPTATALITKRVATDTGYFLFVLTASRTIHFDWGGTATRWNTGYEPPVNKWFHVCVTRDSVGRRLFINGYQKAETDLSGNPGVVPASIDLFIGKNTASGGYQFKGDMSRFMFWDRALTPDEVRRIYDGAVITNGLNVFCPFSSNARDASGKNNHGVSQLITFKGLA